MPILGPNGSVLGVIEMINKAGGTAFSNRDEALLHSTTTLIALAIENSRLFYKTKVCFLSNKSCFMQNLYRICVNAWVL